MFSYIIGILLLNKFGIPKPIRYIVLTLVGGILIVVLIYTVNLFLTLPERTTGHHVQHNSSH